MEVCREGLQEEEYEIEIHVVGATNFYDLLRFIYLAGKWLPRPMGVCVWSFFHTLLAILYSLALFAFFIFILVIFVCIDVCVWTIIILGASVHDLLVSLLVIIVAAAAWIWHLNRCFHDHTMLGRAPGQNLVHYIFSGGEPLAPGARQNPFYFRCDLQKCYFSEVLSCQLMREVAKSSSYWRLQFKSFWQEIFPLYYAVVMEGMQEEEYAIEIHVVEGTDFYNFLRFVLLAGKWFPRPLGVCVWSLFHILLAVLYTLIILASPPLFIVLFVSAVCFDVYMLALYVLGKSFYALLSSLGVIIGAAVAWIWHLIRCFHGHTMPRRSPGQNLVHYIFSSGKSPAPGARQNPFTDDAIQLRDFVHRSCTLVSRVRHEGLEYLPYWRLQFKSLLQEIFPSYDVIVM